MDAQTGYAVGWQGTILKTTDGGTNWVNQNSGVLNDAYSVYFPGDAQTGYVVYDWGIITKTTDGGANWVSQNSGTRNHLFSVHFPIDSQTGYAVGFAGTILKTNNGGVNWTTQASGVSLTLKSIHFPSNTQTGYIVGESGTILKTTDGGVWVEEARNAEFGKRNAELRISPNPFGEQTHISYQLSSPSPVGLKVYNITGQAVKVLGKAHGSAPLQPAGAYQVVWNGRDERGRKVPAGVYLIRLEAGEHREMSKVVVIR